VHEAYIAAGADIIETNTFSCNRISQRDFGLAGEAADLARAGAHIAREAADAAPRKVWVAGSIGPTSKSLSLAPDLSDPAARPYSFDEMATVYREQAEALLEGGADLILIETCFDALNAKAALSAVPENVPVIVSVSVGDRSGRTLTGQTLEAFWTSVRHRNLLAFGLNCSLGADELFPLAEEVARFADVPVICYPNAGLPNEVGGYDQTPGQMAAAVARMAAKGLLNIVGGCCGTTPEHIAALKAALEAHPPVRVSVTERAPEAESAKAERNLLWEKLEEGRRVVAVELDPPVDDDIGFFLDGVRTLRDAGVDAVTIADCPIGRPRADSSILAAKIHRELGVEPLPHMTCRDRNLNATKALLLGLTIEGVHNVLLVTGDPIPSENRDEVKSVFNFNSRKLARFVSSLNETALRTPFQLFAALNVNAPNFSIQLDLAKEKEEAGVCGFLTQPVLSPEAMENLQRAREELRGKLLGGIFPVVSHRNAVFLNNEIAGIRVSDEIIARYEGKSREECEAIAVELSVETANQIAPYTDGLYIMTPFKRVALIERILKAL
jgi:homocysteine S-methyltransferase